MILQKVEAAAKDVASDNVNVVIGPSDQEVLDAALARIRKALKETDHD